MDFETEPMPWSPSQMLDGLIAAGLKQLSPQELQTATSKMTNNTRPASLYDVQCHCFVCVHSVHSTLTILRGT